MVLSAVSQGVEVAQEAVWPPETEWVVLAEALPEQVPEEVERALPVVRGAEEAAVPVLPPAATVVLGLQARAPELAVVVPPEEAVAEEPASPAVAEAREGPVPARAAVPTARPAPLPP
jgi:hypothetical protein